jgi:hypothetical protein
VAKWVRAELASVGSGGWISSEALGDEVFAVVGHVFREEREFIGHAHLVNGHAYAID